MYSTWRAILKHNTSHLESTSYEYNSCKDLRACIRLFTADFPQSGPVYITFGSLYPKLLRSPDRGRGKPAGP